MNRQLFQDFRWINESKATFTQDGLVLYAPPKTDYFYSEYAEAVPVHGPGYSCNAPFFYTRVSGDFVLRVQVAHDFQDTYDSTSVMVMRDLCVWAKACFEKTEFDTHAAVSVVTNHISDDANGCNIQGNTAWLQVARVKNRFAFHYSEDGVHFYMMRYFSLPVEAEIMVGLVPQSPVGSGGDRIYKEFSLVHQTLKNLRAGV